MNRDCAALWKSKVLPGLKTVEGYRGGYILRSEAVKRFAGPTTRFQYSGPKPYTMRARQDRPLTAVALMPYRAATGRSCKKNR